MPSITHIPFPTDNYLWIILSEDERHATIIDPGQPQAILHHLLTHHIQPEAILVTHHHPDHTSGIAAIKAKYPKIKIYGNELTKDKGVTTFVKDNDIISLPQTGVKVKALATPGHTKDHLCYYCEKLDALFSGDTLFASGCGRIFECDAETMYESLMRLRELPDTTLLYPGHAYALNDIAFAR